MWHLNPVKPLSVAPQTPVSALRSAAEAEQADLSANEIAPGVVSFLPWHAAAASVGAGAVVSTSWWMAVVDVVVAVVVASVVVIIVVVVGWNLRHLAGLAVPAHVFFWLHRVSTPRVLHVQVLQPSK